MYILTCLKLLNIKDTTFAFWFAVVAIRCFSLEFGEHCCFLLLLLLLEKLFLLRGWLDWFFLWSCWLGPLSGSSSGWLDWFFLWSYCWGLFVLGFISGNLPHAGDYPPRCTYDMLCVCVGDCPPYYITIYRMCDIYTRVHPLCVMLTTNNNPEALELLELQHPRELDELYASPSEMWSPSIGPALATGGTAAPQAAPELEPAWIPQI